MLAQDDYNIYVDKVLSRYLDIPFLREIKNLANQIRPEPVSEQHIRENFRVHLKTLIEKCAFVRTLVNPLKMVALDNIYVPLTLVTPGGEIKVDKFTANLFMPYAQSIIKDTAGMGKTTLLEFITIEIIKRERGIPFLFELRNLSGPGDLLKQLLINLNTPHILFDQNTIARLATKDFFYVLLDGYDEISQTDRKAVKRDILDLHSHLLQWNYMITSRHDLLDSGFNKFARSSVKPIKIDEACVQVNKYESAYNRHIAEELISEIKLKYEEANLHSFLENPFMVTLLYKIYSSGQAIPETKGKLFFEVYMALLKDHDDLKELERVRKCGLMNDQFTQVIEKFAYDTLEQTTTEYDKKQVLKFIKEAIPEHLKDVTDSQDFLHDLLVAVPLLVDVNFRYRWWQKSFQDYFAANYLSRQDNRLTVLEEIYNSEKAQYLNLLDIYYDLDYVSFEKSIIKLLINEFLQKYERIPEIPSINHVLQTQRRRLLAFHNLIYIYNEHEISYDKVVNQGAFTDPVGVEISNNISLVYQSNFKLDLIRQIGRRRTEVFLKENKPIIFENLKVSPLTTPKQSKYIYKIDSNSGEWYNQHDSFKIINDFLSHELVTPYIFDPKNCEENVYRRYQGLRKM